MPLAAGKRRASSTRQTPVETNWRASRSRFGRGLRRFEVEDQIVQAQNALWRHHGGDPAESDPLPEVRNLVQGISTEHEPHWLVRMLVAQEARFDDRDVADAQLGDALSQEFGHGRRHVDGDHLAAVRGDLDGESSGACSEIDDRRIVVEAVSTEYRNVPRRVVAGLLLVAGDVSGVEMLLPGIGQFVEPPVLHAPVSSSSVAVDARRLHEHCRAPLFEHGSVVCIPFVVLAAGGGEYLAQHESEALGIDLGNGVVGSDQ